MLGLHPQTVAKWLARSRFEPRRSPPRSSVLDPFKGRITRLLDTPSLQRAADLPASARRGISRRHHHPAGLRPPHPAAQAARLSQAALRCPASVRRSTGDAFGTVAVGNTHRRLSFFVIVLAYSRQMYVEFTVSQTMEHFLACHEHAFAAFAGVPCKIMVDNLKSAVLQRLAGVAPVFNPRYLDFARHYGFAIDALQRRARQREGARRVRGGLRQEELLAWAGVDRVQRHPSRRAGLARHHRQCAHPRRDASATRRYACDKSVRICGRSIQHPYDVARTATTMRLQPVPHHPRHQSLFRPRRTTRTAA